MNDQGKIRAIVAHITIIGWIIALVMNNNDKNEFASFYIRQMLGIIILGAVGGMIPIIGIFVAIVVLVFWIISLVGAIGEKKVLIPGIGSLFQDWFRTI